MVSDPPQTGLAAKAVRPGGDYLHVSIFWSKLSSFDAQVWWLPLWPVESLALLDHKPGCSSCRRPQVSKTIADERNWAGAVHKVIVEMQGGADSNAGLHRALLWLQGVCKVN